jgi:short-subunit dehydrogenase
MLIDMQTLKDKNILVIGATGGIGRRAAKLLAGSGAKLFLTGRNKYRLQEVASAVERLNYWPVEVLIFF